MAPRKSRHGVQAHAQAGVKQCRGRQAKTQDSVGVRGGRPVEEVPPGGKSSSARRGLGEYYHHTELPRLKALSSVRAAAVERSVRAEEVSDRSRIEGEAGPRHMEGGPPGGDDLGAVAHRSRPAGTRGVLEGEDGGTVPVAAVGDPVSSTGSSEKETLRAPASNSMTIPIPPGGKPLIFESSIDIVDLRATNSDGVAVRVVDALGLVDRVPGKRLTDEQLSMVVALPSRPLRTGWQRFRFVYDELSLSADVNGAAERSGVGESRGRPRGTRVRKPGLGMRHSHARYVQRLFRKAVSMGCWGRGMLRQASVILAAGSKLWAPRCAGGANLASEQEFADQRKRAGLVLDWYATYVAIVRRLGSGVAPCVVESFCGGGGTTEGTRRVNGTSYGIDHFDQVDYVRRYGPEAFTRGDAAEHSVVKAVRDKVHAVGGFASPPCQAYSTAATHTEHPALIPRVRNDLKSLFDYWGIENVGGAKSAMSEGTVELRGAMFGLRVVRPRLFESNFLVHVDEFLRVPAVALEARCCLGERRRWKRYDEYGRPRAACCGGNVFSPLGVRPWNCTAAQCADAMGVDANHMSYERLAQSVPPAYASLRFAQMCMAIAHDRYGVPVITYDDMLTRPHAARREMSMWVRGAGDASPNAGLLLERAVSGCSTAGTAATVTRPVPAGPAWGSGSRGYDEAAEASHREFFYSHAGGYDRCWSEGLKMRFWFPLASLHPQRRQGESFVCERQDAVTHSEASGVIKLSIVGRDARSRGRALIRSSSRQWLKDDA